MEEYAWIAGGNQMLAHKRKIRAGGSGEVHEVIPGILRLADWEMYNEVTEEVNVEEGTSKL
jgi:serine/threonine protein kinase